jgi:hypothetical protein
MDNDDLNFDFNKIMPKPDLDTPLDSNKNTMSLEDIFVNLRLISKIEIGDKLIQNDKHINIDTSLVQCVSRWLSGNNRADNINFINTILSKAFEYNDKLLNESTDDSAQLLLRLNNDLKNCINGLINLKQTYHFDKLIQSEIDVMIDNIRSKLDTTNKNLKIK